MTDETRDSGDRRVERVLTIRRPAMELYDVWRDLERLPAFMHNVISVVEEGTRSHWVVKAPGGTMSWDAEVTDDRPGERLAWRTLAGADVPNSGEVRFTRATQGKGTEVRVTLTWDPTAGALGAGVAKMFGDDPGKQLKEDLWRFKQLTETGSVPTTRGQSRGSAQADSLKEERAGDQIEPLVEAPSYSD
jgi:uncharacterized membrane protein